MDLTVQTVDDLKDEIYRLKRRNEELEIVVREQDEKLEVVEAAGVLERGGVVAFEESTRYKEMSLLIMQLRSGVEERDGVVKGLKGQVQELRGRVRELELREFERLEAMSGGLQPEVEGKLVGRLREAERELDTLKVERERERDENERRVEGLEADVRGLRVELFSRMSISSVDDQVEN
ncbi:hypothetical protein BCR33DRAFT_544088 [Rhizoclosmatium globosum]|uniref:Uncharacterized protein n=1 Tax=Rhizoclosmatium globosum TaxID=329046 RepID=A0A1Y2B9M6_9FUNG|nr:hypothetical protein BCR33DRAFT_544088 [Rhizoclosmatium globosum]|eukprot:ORY31523.1 hypothetical protein BCR33DRAFT_544088 [Rhizoclosmatium globosum]